MAGAPWDAHTLADEALCGLSADRRQLFAVRLDRWWPDLRDGLSRLYDDPVADAGRARGWSAGGGRLPRPRPRTAPAGPASGRWSRTGSRQPAHAGLRRLRRPVRRRPGRRARADRLPARARRHLPAPDAAAAAARGRQRRRLRGRRLPRGARRPRHHGRPARRSPRRCAQPGISLVLDLVLNHVAREHEWAQAARAGERALPRLLPRLPRPRACPTRTSATLPEVFPDFAPGSFTWDDELDGWVWTTFNSWQWDVNWSNPDVFVEYADIVLFLANAGVEVLRLDAIAFLWKRLGTNCQNQPEVHAITQALRAVARIACPAVAVQGRGDRRAARPGALPRAGRAPRQGQRHRLPQQPDGADLVDAGHAGTRGWPRRRCARLPPAPSTTAWVTYLRCHDDIGWAIDDADAAAVGLYGSAHRAFLSDYYSGEFPGLAARAGWCSRHNPATGDRRISGTAASLVGLEAARSRRPAPVDRRSRRLLLAHAMVLGWGGIPVIWIGRRARPAQRPALGRRARATTATTGGRTGRGWTGTLAAAAARPGHRRRPGVRRPAAPRPGARRVCRTCTRRCAARCSPVADPGVLPVLRRHPLGPMLAALQRHRRLAAVARLAAARGRAGAPVDAHHGRGRPAGARTATSGCRRTPSAGSSTRARTLQPDEAVARLLRGQPPGEGRRADEQRRRPDVGPQQGRPHDAHRAVAGRPACPVRGVDQVLAAGGRAGRRHGAAGTARPPRRCGTGRAGPRCRSARGDRRRGRAAAVSPPPPTTTSPPALRQKAWPSRPPRTAAARSAAQPLTRPVGSNRVARAGVGQPALNAPSVLARASSQRSATSRTSGSQRRPADARRGAAATPRCRPPGAEQPRRPRAARRTRRPRPPRRRRRRVRGPRRWMLTGRPITCSTPGALAHRCAWSRADCSDCR